MTAEPSGRAARPEVCVLSRARSSFATGAPLRPCLGTTIAPRRRATFRHTLLGMRIGRQEVALTNLDKVFFPESGLTKGDLIRYYLDLAPYALNHVERRPMQMKRYPNGVEGEFFYQKRVPNPHPEWLETVHVLFGRSGRTADFPVVTKAAGLAWIINLGCIELHTWHCRVTDV